MNAGREPRIARGPAQTGALHYVYFPSNRRSPLIKFRIIAVDLAQDVFEVAVANERCRILERHWLSRKAFPTFLAAQPPAGAVVE